MPQNQICGIQKFIYFYLTLSSSKANFHLLLHYHFLQPFCNQTFHKSSKINGYSLSLLLPLNFYYRVVPIFSCISFPKVAILLHFSSHLYGYFLFVPKMYPYTFSNNLICSRKYFYYHILYIIKKIFKLIIFLIIKNCTFKCFKYNIFVKCIIIYLPVDYLILVIII